MKLGNFIKYIRLNIKNNEEIHCEIKVFVKDIGKQLKQKYIYILY